MLPDRRRRGKSVVFDDAPSVVTTSHENNSKSYLHRRRRSSFKRLPWREAGVLVIFVVMAVVLLLKFRVNPSRKPLIYYGSKHVVEQRDPFIIPTTIGGQGKGGSRGDGVKKAPGDNQGSDLNGLDAPGTRRTDTLHLFQSDENSPKYVVVTLLDDRLPREHLEKIIQNRKEYCEAYGFGLLMKFQSDYAKFFEPAGSKKSSWARNAIASEAQYSFPEAEWFWYLDGSALIMDSTRDISKFLTMDSLSKKMRVSQPVLRHENTHIQTYKNSKAENLVFVTFLDSVGVSSTSFCFRNTFAAKAFMQIWGEPLFRTFSGTPDEQYALGHLLQWHPQLLARTGIVDAKELAAFADVQESNPDIASQLDYNPGDFVVVMQCDMTTEQCRHDFQTRWNARKVLHPKNTEKDVKVAKDDVQNQVQVEAQERAQEKAEKQKQNP